MGVDGPTGTGLALRFRRLPQVGSIDRLMVSSRPMVFEIDLEHVISLTGFSFATDGWDPLVATLEQCRDDPCLPYAGSVLADLFATFQPRTVHDALFHGVPWPLPPFDRLPARWLGRLWTLGPRDVRRAYANDLLDPATSGSPGHPYFGPQSASHGRWQFDRAIRVFESVRRHGYRPARHHGGHVRGYFLVGNDRWRFVVVDGHHRVAALRSLRAKSVAVQFWGGPSVIVGVDLARWTTEHGGPYPPAVAARLFERLLNSDGARKAADLGLMPAN